MICFVCPGCNAVLTAPPTDAGEVISCEGCAQRLRVPNPVAAAATTASATPDRATPAVRMKAPAPPKGAAFRCGHCGTSGRFRGRTEIGMAHCPKCGHRIGEAESVVEEEPIDREDLLLAIPELRPRRTPIRYFLAVFLGLVIGVGAIPYAVFYREYLACALVAAFGALLSLYALILGLWHRARGRFVALLCVVLCASGAVTITMLAGGIPELLRPVREAVRRLVA